MKVITSVSVLHLCSQRGADLGKDKDGYVLLPLMGLTDLAEELFGTTDRKGDYVSHKGAESPSPATTTSPAIPSSPLLHTRAPELGHLEDAQRERLHCCNRSSGTGSRDAPLPGATLPFLGKLSTAFTASNAPPEPAQGDLSLPRQNKVFLFQ